MITTIAILIITTIVARYYKRVKGKKTSEDTDTIELLSADELIRKTGAEIKGIDDDGKYTILYQGGCFEIITSNETYMDVYYHFAEFEEHEAIKALYCMNLINLEYLVWNCKLNMCDASDENAGNYYAYLAGRMELTGNMDRKVKQLKDMLTFAFQIGRELEQVFEEENMGKESVDNRLLELTFHNKMERYLKISETIHSPKVEIDDVDNKMTLRAIFDKLDIPIDDKQINVRIILGDKVIVPELPNKFMDDDLCEYIRDINDKSRIQEPAFIIKLHERILIMNLKLRDVTSNRMYYTLNISGCSDLNDPDNNFSIQTLLEVKLSDGKDEYWEVKFMIDDAMDKHNNGNKSELTDEQSLLLKNVVPSLNADLYWGKKFHNRMCYYQALIHYQRAFKYIQSEWLGINDEGKNVYARIALYIGVIYMELGLMVKAHYYLDIASNYNTSIGGITEFTNCLCNMRDPHALEYINHSIKKVNGIIESSEEMNEPLERLLDFLYRRMAYSLINHRDYSTAEDILKEMIKNERNVDFANKELAYIAKLREQE